MTAPACIHPEGSVELALDRLRYSADRLEMWRTKDPRRVPHAFDWLKKIVGELSVALEKQQVLDYRAKWVGVITDDQPDAEVLALSRINPT
jgi:hypothetical protein